MQGYRRVGVGTCVEHDAVVGEAYLLHLVDKFSLDIALVVLDSNVRILCLQLGQILFKR